MASISELIHQPWLYAILSLTYVLSILTVIIVILGENRNPVKSLAWVTILILLPAVGLVLYIFFGRNIKNKRMISRRNRRRLRAIGKPDKSASPPRLEYAQRELAQLITGMTGYPIYSGNKVEVFGYGQAKFDSLLNDLRQARHTINLQYYIFEADDLGQQIAAILIDKAMQGVKVRVIYDHVGSFRVNSHFFSSLRAAGVEAYPFFKVAFIPFASRVNWRNHRKIAVIDGQTGYIGGMNIANRYMSDRWRDCHLRLQGPGVKALQFTFARDWLFMGKGLIEDTTTNRQYGSDNVQLITGGPMSQWNTLEQTYLKAIGLATKRIFLQTPYYLPPDTLLMALQTAALAGVDVRVMMPRHSDSFILSYASRSYIAESLRAGIKIYLYEPGMLHSKVLIVDDDISCVGSTNFDFRSFEHNFEGSLLVYSADINRQLRNIFLSDQSHSARILPDTWRKRSIIHKSLESTIRLLAPIL